MQTNQIITVILALLGIIAIVYLIMSYNDSPAPYTNMMMSQPMMSQPMMGGYEGFVGDASPAGSVSVSSGGMPMMPSVQRGVNGSEGIEFDEQPMSLGETNNGSQLNQMPSECYPKDVLSSADLLPLSSNSQWAQVSPSGQGSLADQNFLTSGFHIGINTVGQTLRNANRQLRSEAPNPQVQVSPWGNTTIEADINRKPLEIGQGDL